jgi:hypothetical protein
MKTHTSASKTVSSAKAFAAKTYREYGPCDTIRAVAQRYKSLKRGDVLSIADSLKINRHTANTQFQRVRSGEIEIKLS